MMERVERRSGGEDVDEKKVGVMRRGCKGDEEIRLGGGDVGMERGWREDGERMERGWREGERMERGRKDGERERGWKEEEKRKRKVR